MGNIIMQADVPANSLVALTTRDILVPGRIVQIGLPKAPDGEGWIDLKFAICKRKFMSAVTTADVKDITVKLTGEEKVYLPKEATAFECDYIVKKYYWWFVIFVHNKTLEEQFITCSVKIEKV